MVYSFSFDRSGTGPNAAYFPGSFSVPNRCVVSRFGVSSGFSATTRGPPTSVAPRPPMDSAFPRTRRILPAGMRSRMTSSPSPHSIASPGTVTIFPSGPNFSSVGRTTPFGFGVTLLTETPFCVETMEMMPTIL